MPARSSWKGYVKVSLVAFPVKAYTATSSSDGSVALNQLHDECNSRIKYTKTCPLHGEVPSSEIVQGYQYEKDQYVRIDPDELDQLRTENDKAINVDAFVEQEAIDPIYHTDKSYYLVPDGPIGQKPYALVRDALAELGRCGIAQVVMSKREKLVMLRPVENLLSMTVLHYDAVVRKPAAYAGEVTDAAYAAEEMQLARSLVEGLTREDLDLAEYKDAYVERLTELIQARVEGRELVTPEAGEEPRVLSIMDALQQSVARVTVPPSKSKKTATKKSVAKKKAPARKAAASAKTRSKTTTKKKAKKKSG